MALTKVTNSMIEGAMINVLDFGADPTGVADSAAAIQLAVNQTGTIYFPEGTYKIQSTINVPSNVNFFFGTSFINVDVGSSSGFKVLNGLNVTFNGGKFYQGTAGALFEIKGTVGGSACRQIRFQQNWIESSLLDVAYEIGDNSRQIHISDCHIQAQGGIKTINKVVEFNVSNCNIFGTGTATTAINITRTTDGSNYQPEGFNFSNCTVDFFPTGFQVSDIFQMCVTNGYYSCDDTFNFTGTVGTAGAALSHVVIHGCVIGGRIKIGSFSGGRPLNFVIVANSIIPGSLDGILVDGNATKVLIDGNNFSNGSENGINIKTNTSNIVVTNNWFDDTFDSAGKNPIKLDSGAGDNIVIKNNHIQSSSTTTISQSRPAVRTGNTGKLSSDISDSNITPATVTAGNSFTGACGFQFGAGEKGLIIVNLRCTNSAAGDLQIVPNSANIVLRGASANPDLITLPVIAAAQSNIFVVPYEIVADINGSIGLANSSAGSVVVTAPSSITCVRL